MHTCTLHVRIVLTVSVSSTTDIRRYVHTSRRVKSIYLLMHKICVDVLHTYIHVCVLYAFRFAYFFPIHILISATVACLGTPCIIITLKLKAFPDSVTVPILYACMWVWDKVNIMYVAVAHVLNPDVTSVVHLLNPYVMSMAHK